MDTKAWKPDRAPEVLSDLRTLPFTADYADEAMAIHVIEHFYKWEVHDLLKEWVRVLKPGGRLILECPDVGKVLYHFYRALERQEEPDPTLVWHPLYGDPRYQDPLMCHRWGYLPFTLARELHKVGLVDIKQEPAQYHYKDLRDLRVTGVKPGVAR